MIQMPKLGPSAFQLDAHGLLMVAQSAPDEEARDLLEEFAHALATIQNLPEPPKK